MLTSLACLLLFAGAPHSVQPRSEYPSNKVVNQPAEVTLTGGNGGHSFKVHLQLKSFVLGSRRLSSMSDGSTNLCDGKVAYGSDWWEPESFNDLEFCKKFYREELTAFEVWIDSKTMDIEESIWNTCFDPNLGTDPVYPYVFAWISRDGSRVVVKMLGGDAAGSYRAIWTIRSSGKHERTVDRDS